MIKINYVELEATVTSANITTFDFIETTLSASLPAHLKGLTHMIALVIPTCSAAGTSATLIYADSDNNTLWTSTSNIYDDAAALTGEKVELPIAGIGEHFHITLNQRCSGVDGDGTPGTAALRLWVQQEG